MNRRSFLALMMLAACVPEPKPVVAAVEASFWLHGDTRFTFEERKAFIMAADLWRRHTSGRVNLWIEWDLSEEKLLELKDQPRIIRVDSLDSRTQAVDGGLLTGKARAFVRPAGEGLPVILAVVADRLKPEDWYRVALHELGHVVGVDELEPWRSGIMNKSNPGYTFTPDDDVAIRALGLMP